MEKRFIAGISTILLLISTCAYSQSEQVLLSLIDLSFEELLNVKISINKIEEDSKLGAGNIYVLSEEEIKQRGYKDLKDVLNDIPGISYSGYAGNVYMTEIGVRGIRGNDKVVVLRDGIKLNNPSSVTNTWGNNCPLHDVKQIEILLGPAAVVYGKDTYSALINIKTQKKKHYRIEMATGSYNTYVPAFSVSHPTSKGYVFASGRAYISEGYNRVEEYPERYKGAVDEWKTKITDWEEQFSEKDMEANAFVNDYNMHLELKHGKFTFGGMFISLNEVNSLSHVPEKYLVNHQSPIHTRQYHGYTKYETDITKKIQSKTIATYLNEYRGDDYGFTYVDDHPIYGNGYKKYYNSLDISMQLEQQLIYTMNPKLKINFGLSAENVNSVPQAQSFLVQQDPEDRVAEDGIRFQDYGLFLQGIWTPKKWFKILAGGRLNYSSIYKETFNPRFDLIIQPVPHLTLKGLYGQAYLAPSIKTMFFENSGTTFLQLTNPDLKPQKIATYGFDANYQLSRSMTLQTKLYYNDASDIVGQMVISQEGNFQIRKPMNIDEFNSYGGEFIWRAKLSNKIRLNAWYAYSEQVEKNYNYTLDQKIIKTDQHLGNIGLTYLPTKNLGAHLNVHYMGKIKTNDRNSEFHGGYLPSVVDVDLNIFVLKVFNHLDFNLNINNVLNQEQYHLEARGYGTRLSKIPQPKRHFLISAKYSF